MNELRTYGKPQEAKRETLSVIVVEDEPLARERVCRLVDSRSDFSLLSSAGDGHEALSLIRKHRPQVVLIDIRLPGLDGLTVISSLGTDVPPVVIFMTALGDKAVEAFGVGAIDYLLKPFDTKRLNTALDRALRVLRQIPSASAGSTSEPVLPGRIAVKVGRRFIFINLADISLITSDSNRCVIHTPLDAFRTNEGFGMLLSRLPTDRFARISRTEAVNLAKVKSINPRTHGDMSITLQSGESRVLTRTRRAEVLDLLARL